jgi:hypothetical protein
MARTIPAALLASTTAPQLAPFTATRMDFDSGTVCYWTGYGVITIDGNGYQGIGTLGSISAIEETEDLSARGITLQLSGIPSALVALALTEDYQGRTASVMFGALNESTGAVIESITVFAGRMDVMTITDDGSTAVINFSVENKLVDFQRTRESRYTHEEQLRRYPGDNGLEYVAGLQDKTIYWGNSNSTGFRGGAGAGGNTNPINSDEY